MKQFTAFKLAPFAHLSLLFAGLTASTLTYASVLSTGADHTCAVSYDGVLKCWGSNGGGKLGLRSSGAPVLTSSPVAVADSGFRYVSVVAALAHTCGITSSGAVRCWGTGQNGRLGDGAQTNRFVPVQVVGLSSSMEAVSARGAHSCALTSGGTVYCWGYNEFGQLGNNTTIQSLVPVAVSGLTSSVVSIANGTNHSCALTTAGGVKCWGSNQHGRLGIGSTIDQRTPQDVVGLTEGVVSLVSGDAHSCALLSAGTVKCWGNGNLGRLGTGVSDHQHVPADVVGLGGFATEIFAGHEHTCARLSGGVLKCWGSNAHRQIGDGSNVDRYLPVVVTASISGLTEFSTGHQHSCGMTNTHRMVCWGTRALGSGVIHDSSPDVALDVSGFSSDVVYVDAHSQCGIAEHGKLMCWGRKYLGSNEQTYRGPVSLHSGVPGSLLMIRASYGRGDSIRQPHYCALDSDGKVWCWGHNGHGQLGDGSLENRSEPVLVQGLAAAAVQVSVGEHHSCALDIVNRVFCWGTNYAGQLGVGEEVEYSRTPVHVNALPTNVRSIASFSSSNCVVTTSGALKCWGANGSGQLGDGTTDVRYLPVDVIGLGSGVASVSLGADFLQRAHTCAAMVTGGVKCWGSNSYGQLGDGSGIQRLTPVNVENLNDATWVDAGHGHTCALTAAGGVRCWGYNNSGQLGDGTQSNRTMPVAVHGLDIGMVQVSSGRGRTCALSAAGQGWCWGDAGIDFAHAESGRFPNPVPTWYRDDGRIFRNGFEP